MAAVCGASLSAFGQQWRPGFVPEPTASEANPVLRWVRDYSTAVVDYEDLERATRNAPLEILGLPDQPGVVLTLPTSDGRLMRFRVWQNDIIGKQVRAQVPEIRVLAGQGIDDPTAILRATMFRGRFNAMMMTADGTFFIEPMRRNPDNTYFLYSRQDSIRHPGWTCTVLCDPAHLIESSEFHAAEPQPTQRNTGPNLWTFRLAVNGTAEYTAFHGGSANAVSAMITTVNRVDGVYRRDLSIRLNLTYTNAFTNAATDGFTNGNAGAMLSENQTITDANVGNANYDVGHVFGTNSGGIAGLGVVGLTGNKARGVTGSGSPVGDSFDIDYVAHELGHQFGAPHSFNGVTGSCGGGNRSALNAFEPGSGSSIMAYAGICGSEDSQSNSDPIFHHSSVAIILPYRTPTRGAVSSATGNGVPTVSAGLDYAIPVNTAFRLTMTASDPNNHPMTFAWDPYNAPPNTQTIHQGSTTATTNNTSRPLFRSFNPSTNPTWYFPQQALVLANNYTNQFQFVPNVARTLTFRAVARDNQAAGGGLNWDAMTITVSGTSAFRVTSPNTAVSWNRNDLQTVTWDVAGTTAAPISTPNVNIWLSTNGGGSFFNNTATLLASNVPNDGSHPVSLGLGTAAGTAGRIFVEGAGNIFYDVSDTNFSITTANTAPSLAVISNQIINEEAPFTLTAVGTDPNTAQTLTYSLTNPPIPGLTINSSTGQISWTPTEAQGPNTYSVTVQVADNAQPTPATATRTFSIQVNEVPKNVTGTVAFEGWSGSVSGRTVSYELRQNLGGSVLDATTIALNASGAYSRNATVNNGTYSVRIGRAGYLWKRVDNVSLTSAGATVPLVTLIPGDLNGDNEIDLSDIDQLIGLYLSPSALFDFDNSGEVDLTDLDLVISNYLQSGD